MEVCTIHDAAGEKLLKRDLQRSRAFDQPSTEMAVELDEVAKRDGLGLTGVSAVLVDGVA
jgi:hypothetical protein